MTLVTNRADIGRNLYVALHD